MKSQYKRLLLEQLDETMARLSCMHAVRRPLKGWLRAVRETLGMSGRQFAKRLSVSAPRITKLEKSEIAGSVTLNSMRQAADALGCEFVYALIPRQENLKEIVRDRAKKLAQKRLTRVSHTMLLEDQQLSSREQEKVLEADIDDLMKNLPKELWDDHNDF